MAFLMPGQRILGTRGSRQFCSLGPVYFRSWPAFGSASPFAVNDDRRERTADLSGSLHERTKKMAVSGNCRGEQPGVGAVGGIAGRPRGGPGNEPGRPGLGGQPDEYCATER